MAIPATRDQFTEYCLHNKYSVWYFALIDQAISRKWTRDTSPCYVEGHHIVMRTGENNSRWGATVLESTRQKISVANKGKLSKEKHPLWGVGHSEATRNKCSVNAARKALSKKWFNNGVNAFLVFPQDAPPTWNLGRK